MSGLPPIDLSVSNASPLERALERLTRRIDDLDVPIGRLMSPTNAPASVLPWLAFGLSVDSWRGDWTEATKRGAIAASIPIHRRKGTVGAVRAAMTAVAAGAPVNIIEWFQPGGTGQPHTATIEADVTAGAPINLIEDLVQAAGASAPVRVHMSARLVARPRSGAATTARLRRPIVSADLAVRQFRRMRLSAGPRCIPVIRRPRISARLAPAA